MHHWKSDLFKTWNPSLLRNMSSDFYCPSMAGWRKKLTKVFAKHSIGQAAIKHHCKGHRKPMSPFLLQNEE